MDLQGAFLFLHEIHDLRTVLVVLQLIHIMNSNKGKQPSWDLLPSMACDNLAVAHHVKTNNSIIL